MFLSKRVINVHNIFEFCIRVYCAFVLNSRIFFNRFTRDFSLLTKLVFLFKSTRFLNTIILEFVISSRDILKTTLLTTIFWRLTFFLTRKKNIIFFIFFLVDFNQINFIQKTIMNYLLTYQLNEISFHKIEFHSFYDRCNNVNRFFESRCDIEQRYRNEYKIYQIVEFFNLDVNWFVISFVTMSLVKQIFWQYLRKRHQTIDIVNENFAHNIDIYYHVKNKSIIIVHVNAFLIEIRSFIFFFFYITRFIFFVRHFMTRVVYYHEKHIIFVSSTSFCKIEWNFHSSREWNIFRRRYYHYIHYQFFNKNVCIFFDLCFFRFILTQFSNLFHMIILIFIKFILFWNKLFRFVFVQIDLLIIFFSTRRSYFIFVSNSIRIFVNFFLYQLLFLYLQSSLQYQFSRKILYLKCSIFLIYRAKKKNRWFRVFRQSKQRFWERNDWYFASNKKIRWIQRYLFQ